MSYAVAIAWANCGARRIIDFVESIVKVDFEYISGRVVDNCRYCSGWLWFKKHRKKLRRREICN